MCGWNTKGLWLLSKQLRKASVSIFMFDVEFLSLKYRIIHLTISLHIWL